MDEQVEGAQEQAQEQESFPEVSIKKKFPDLKRLKVLSMGDPKVGKSCIIKRYCEERFLEEYVATIGIDFGVKSFQTHLEEVKINFWDVGGDAIYFDIRNEFYKDIHAAFLVFDVNDRTSFDNLEKWVNELKEFLTEPIELVLVGNKIDLGNRAVSKADGQKMAASLNAKYYETSCQSGENIEDMFADLFYNSLALKFEEYVEEQVEKPQEYPI